MTPDTMLLLETLSASLRAAGMHRLADRLEAGEDIERELERAVRAQERRASCSCLA